MQDMVDRVMTMEEGTRAYLLAPIVRDRKGEYQKGDSGAAKAGLSARVKLTGSSTSWTSRPTLDKKFRHDIDVVVDRIVVREGLETRLADSFRTALDLAMGSRSLRRPRAMASLSASPFLENFACPVSGFTIPEIEPRLFSFNAPFRGLPDLRRPGGGAFL